MAYDEGLAELIREDLGERDGLSERKMFGGLAFMLDGNMVAGVYQGGGMFRVGPERMADALAVGGAAPMKMGERTMGGYVTLSPEAMGDDDARGALMRLALACVAELPPK
jgi:TfoX/Sxy family transcriptional regulator of competence genes